MEDLDEDLAKDLFSDLVWQAQKVAEKLFAEAKLEHDADK
jgi:hypothetical protein